MGHLYVMIFVLILIGSFKNFKEKLFFIFLKGIFNEIISLKKAREKDI